MGTAALALDTPALDLTERRGTGRAGLLRSSRTSTSRARGGRGKHFYVEDPGHLDGDYREEPRWVFTKVEQLSSSDRAKLLSEMIGVPVTDSTLQVLKDALAHLGVVSALALNNLLSIIRKMKESPGFDSVLMRVKGGRSDIHANGQQRH